jgi:hypothetical protein
MQQVEAEVRGILAGAPGVKNIKFEGTDLRDYIKTVLKDEFASLRKNRLTWKQGELEDTPVPGMQIGLLRKDKGYIGPFGGGKYYVQNGMLLRSNGTPVAVETLSKVRPKEKLKDGTEVEYPSDYERAKEIIANWLRGALALDANLCPYCAAVSPKTRKDYMAHVYNTHGKEFLADVESNEDSRLDLQADAHGEERVPYPLMESTPKTRGRPVE